MLYDSLYDNDHAKFEMERAGRKAAESWRFRQLQSAESRALSAVLSSVYRFLQHLSPAEKAVIGSVRQQPSY